MNSIPISQHAELRGLALKLQAQDLTQASALVELERLLVYIEDIARCETVKTLARMAQDQARKAKECEKSASTFTR